MPVASGSIEIACDPKTFYGVLTDFEHYPDFQPKIRACRLVEKKGETYVVDEEIKVIKTFKFTLKFQGKPGEKLTWEMVKGDFKKNSGSWAIKKLGKDRIEATFTLDLEVGMFVPSSILGKLVQDDMPEMLKRFKERAEALKG